MSVALERVTRIVDGVPTIRNVSLTLERGALSVLLGPTLSGKTSIMRLLAGLDKPTEGRIVVDGKDVTGLDVRKRSVAMVYQQFINYPSLTVYENIASPLRVQGKTTVRTTAAANSTIGKVMVSPLKIAASAKVMNGCSSWTCATRAMPPMAMPAFHAKKPIHCENRAT